MNSDSKWIFTGIRVAVWLVPSVLVIAVVVSLGALGEVAAVSEARSLFFAKNYEFSLEEFRRLRNSWWVGSEARSGAAVCEAQLGRESASATGELDTSPFALTPLLMRELRAGDLERCLRLVQVARRGSETTADLFEAAVLLELGRFAEAEEVWRRLPEPARATFLGRRLGEALTLLGEKVLTVVRDRNGELIGPILPDGSFRDSYILGPAVLPRALVKELSSTEFGEGLRLSVDIDLTRMVDGLFQRVLDRIDRAGFGGSIVLLDAKTGEVLAAVSDTAALEAGGTPALEQRLEPASIAKLITVTAALRAGIDVDAEIAQMECRFGNNMGGWILYCPTHRNYDWRRPKRLGGLAEALAVSCNSVFARLGFKVGWKGMLEEQRLYGFDSDGGNPFRMGTIILTGGTNKELADLAVGLDATDITPLHGALIAAVMANEGRMPEPTFFHGADSLLGLNPSLETRPAGRRVIEERWLPLLLEAMAAVTGRGYSSADGEWWWGTAYRVAPVDFPVAMKTGTGGNQNDGFHVNYIGVGPLPNPRVAFCVRVTGKGDSNDVRRAGYELTAELLRGLGRAADARGWR
jgi:hypothetical protein